MPKKKKRGEEITFNKFIFLFQPSENERKQKDRKRSGKIVVVEGDGDTNCNWRTWNDLQGLERRLEELENQKTNQDQRNNKRSQEQLEYSEKSWRANETYCHSDNNARSLVVKNSLSEMIIE